MTLKPTDMLEIQSAIDAYERKFPRRPAPSAEVALAWRLGKREWAKRQAAERTVPQGDSDRPRGSRGKPDSVLTQQECNRLMWAWDQFRLSWLTGGSSEDAPAELLPWVRKVLVVGWWGVVAVVVASVFFFGAIVGGFK
ncbi:MAG TPA: hypothetical protein VFE27_04145 [Acidobacteriaceae bacterium]|jgi:hypothetical protein|nr:hypothetical protein [Acidobacteriaceae bacterium]